jgi:hypothetical protein
MIREIPPPPPGYGYPNSRLGIKPSEPYILPPLSESEQFIIAQEREPLPRQELAPLSKPQISFFWEQLPSTEISREQAIQQLRAYESLMAQKETDYSPITMRTSLSPDTDDDDDCLYEIIACPVCGEEVFYDAC